MSNEPKSIKEVISASFARYNLHINEVELICSKIKPLHLRKGEKFSQSRRVCKQLGILVNGLLYAAYESENADNEIVSRFFYKPQNIIVSSFESFSTGQPANESIVSIEDSLIFCIQKEDLDDLYKQIAAMNVIGREMAEQSYTQALNRIHVLQTMSVDQRIEEFFNKNIQLVNRVQRQHLASYLGTNRNAISKHLKNKRSKILQ